MSDPVAHRKFRKKPVVIEAIQFTDADQPLRDLLPELSAEIRTDALGPYALVSNSRGNYEAVPLGYWFVRERGEWTWCSSDIFEATYEPA